MIILLHFLLFKSPRANSDATRLLVLPGARCLACSRRGHISHANVGRGSEQPEPYSNVLVIVPTPTPSCLAMARMLAPSWRISMTLSLLKIRFGRPMGRFFRDLLLTVLPTFPAL